MTDTHGARSRRSGMTAATPAATRHPRSSATGGSSCSQPGTAAATANGRSKTTQASIPGAFSCSAPKTTDEPGAIPKRSPPRSRPRSGHGTLPARATPSSSAAHPTKGVSSCRPTTNGWETTDGSNPTRNCSSLMTKVSHGSWEPFHSEAGTKARSPNSQTARCC